MSKDLNEERKKICEIIEAYNKLAKETNFNSRLALLTAEVDDYDLQDDEDLSEEEKKEKEEIDYEQKARNSTYGPYVSINAPEADCWFPSAICEGY